MSHLAGLCASRQLEPLLLGRDDDRRWPGLADQAPGAGPLAALGDVLTHLTSDSQNTETAEVLLLAVDLPLLAGADLDWLLQQQPPEDASATAPTSLKPWAIVPQHQGKAQWAFTRYSATCLPVIQQLLQDEKRALYHLGQAIPLATPTVPEITGERLFECQHRCRPGDG